MTQDDEIVTEGQDKLVKCFGVFACAALIAFAAWWVGLQTLINIVALATAATLAIALWLGIDFARHT